MSPCHTPFFDRFISFLLVILNPFYRIIFSNFYILHFMVFYQSFFNILYLSILFVRFANILLVFSQICVHINLFFIYLFYNISLPFSHLYSLLETEKSRLLRWNFGREVTLKYLIWFRRDIYLFIYLSFSYYFILSCLFLTFYFFYSFYSFFLFCIFVFPILCILIIYFICVL